VCSRGRELMKFRVVGLVAFIALLSSYGVAQNAKNPLDVALLRWYPISTTSNFTSCTAPRSMTFDGTHIWIACFDISNPGTSAPIQEFNRSDGVLIRTVNIPVTANTLSVTLGFDGSNIWAADEDNPGKLYKIQASTGTIQSTISLPNYPTVGAFDGTFVWTANAGNNTLSKVNALTGAVSTFQLFTCEGPIGPVFDGTNYWVSCQMNASPDPFIVQELDANGNQLASVGTGISPGSLVFDGTNIWVENCSFWQCLQASVSRINVSTLVATPFAMGGCGASDLAFDGVYIWASGWTWTGANCSSGSKINIVSKLQASSGSLVSTYNLLGSVMSFDGANVWAVSGANLVTKF
jgi:hypothetical protein